MRALAPYSARARPRIVVGARVTPSRSVPIKIDEDVRVEYWTDIRGQLERVAERAT